ncbi:MAG: primosome assembly protein PriA, partial [Ilumatobacteraceae bacterium]
MIARVVPDVIGLDKQFDYLVPEEMSAAVRVGTIVRVPLGPRRVRAWVVELLESTDVARLKPLAAVVGLGPDPALVGVCAWAAHRWAGRLRSLLVAASPPTVVRAVAQVPASRGVRSG